MNEPRPFWRRRWVRRSTAAILALCLAGVGLHFWQRKLVDWQLDAIRAAGEPVTRADLEWFYPTPPPEKDTTQLWLAAFTLFEEAIQTDGEADQALPFVAYGYEDGPPLPGEPFPHLELAERYLQRRAEALKLVYEAVALGGAARYPINPEPDKPLFPDFMSDVRKATRVLLLQSLVHAHRGETSSTVEALTATLVLARSLDDVPETVPGLLKGVVTCSAVTQIAELMPDVPFDERDLRGFQAMLRERAVARNLWAEACGDRVAALGAFGDPQAMNSLPQRYRFSPFWWGNVRAYLEFQAGYVAAAKQHLPTAVQQAESVHTEVCRRNRMLYGMAQDRLIGQWYFFRSEFRINAQIRSVDAAIGVELFRRVHRRLPRRLDDLVPDFLPDVPIDLYSNEPLRYRVADDRYVVYSVGKDGRDDGGCDLTKKGEPDLVVEIRLPKGTQ